MNNYVSEDNDSNRKTNTDLTWFIYKRPKYMLREKARIERSGREKGEKEKCQRLHMDKNSNVSPSAAQIRSSFFE